MRTRTKGKRRMAAVVAALLVAVSLVVGACAGGRDDEAAAPPAEAMSPPPAELVESGDDARNGVAEPAEEVPPSAEPAAAPPAEESASGAGLDGIGAIPVGDLLVPSDVRVIQTASLSVTVAKGDFEETVDRARQIAATLRGFVTGSTAIQGTGDDRLVRGTLVVRVPQELYADAMSQFSRLGKVVGRQESGTDVSAQYVDLESRARHLEAVEAQLLGFLNETNTVADALVIQDRLNAVQLQLEEIRGQLRYLDDQSSFATISLDVAERGAPVAKPTDGDGWGFGEAWSAAARGFETVIGGLFVALVTAGPILAALVALGIGLRVYLRRRRADSAPKPGTPSGSQVA